MHWKIYIRSLPHSPTIPDSVSELALHCTELHSTNLVAGMGSPMAAPIHQGSLHTQEASQNVKEAHGGAVIPVWRIHYHHSRQVESKDPELIHHEWFLAVNSYYPGVSFVHGGSS